MPLHGGENGNSGRKVRNTYDLGGGRKMRTYTPGKKKDASPPSKASAMKLLGPKKANPLRGAAEKLVGRKRSVDDVVDRMAR